MPHDVEQEVNGLKMLAADVMGTSAEDRCDVGQSAPPSGVELVLMMSAATAAVAEVVVVLVVIAGVVAVAVVVAERIVVVVVEK